MAGMGSISLRGLRELQTKLEKLQDVEGDFMRSCTKEIAARLLREAIQRTPVGDYTGAAYQCKARKGPKMNHHSWKVQGHTGGTLRRGWSAQENNLAVGRIGDTYVVEVINPVPYASYVEYGHRTAGHKGWVRGHFMLAISEQEVQRAAPALLKRKVDRILREYLR